MLKNIKSIYIDVWEEVYLKLVHHNKELQEKLDISIEQFKNYKQVEIEIIPEFMDEEEIFKCKFINVFNKFCKSILIHRFFDDVEIKRNYIKGNEKISRIKIIIDGEAKNFNYLFSGCECIKKLNL